METSLEFLFRKYQNNKFPSWIKATWETYQTLATELVFWNRYYWGSRAEICWSYQEKYLKNKSKHTLVLFHNSPKKHKRRPTYRTSTYRTSPKKEEIHFDLHLTVVIPVSNTLVPANPGYCCYQKKGRNKKDCIYMTKISYRGKGHFHVCPSMEGHLVIISNFYSLWIVAP